MNALPIAWHYTTGDRARQIVASGSIIPATVGVPTHEKPIVWFSRNGHWEATATKGIVTQGTRRDMTIKEMMQMAGGIFRFGVPLEQLIRWPALARAAGMRTGTQRALERAGRGKGAMPSDWAGCLEAVSVTRVVTIQQFKDAVWVDALPNDVQESGISR